LQLVAAGLPVEVVAQAVHMDAGVLYKMLDFIARTTDLIEFDGGAVYRFKNYSLAEIVFQFQKFIGAYGASVRRFAAFPTPFPEGGGVNEGALAAAFAGVGIVPSNLAKRLQRAGYHRLVDLGCGPASLLIEMALADKKFTGIGLERSSAMCRVARSQVSEAGVRSQVAIKRADLNDIGGVL
jgi:hypothetical protein